jgi:GNAT superfamily N-acetyltransferase
MTTDLDDMLDARLALRPIGVDDYSAVRHLHTTSLRAQTYGVLSDAEVVAFVRLAYSPAYTAILMKEDVYGAWLDGELVGTVSWQANGGNGLIARIGCIFVRHQGYGIGRRLLAEVEGRAQQCGFRRLAAGVTANAVRFFQRQGYAVASRGVKTLALGCKLPVTFLRKDTLDPRSSMALN